MHPSEFRAKTLDAKARTVEVLFATERPVQRSSYRNGDYLEVLEVTPKAINLERLNAGASFLDSHAFYAGMNSRIGGVVPDTVRISNGQAFATVKLSRSESGNRVLADLEDGIPVPISVGYRIHKFERTEGDDANLPIMRAIDWEPYELSAVPIPADPAGQARNDQSQNQENEGPKMPKAKTKTRKLSTRATTERASTITDLVARADQPATRATGFIDGDMTPDQVREALFDEMVAAQGDEGLPNTRSGFDQRAGEVDQMSAALVDQIIPGRSTSEPNEYRGISLRECAKLIVERELPGQSIFANDQVITRALNGTSDFPILMQTTAQAVLRSQYELNESPLKKLAGRRIAQNFKPLSSITLGGAPALEKVNEHGEFHRGTIGEGKEEYTIATYGKVLGLTRQAMVNDELDAFGRIPHLMAKEASMMEGDLLSMQVIMNPQMSDNAVFHASHNNISSTTGEITPATLSAALVMMRNQKDDKGRYLNLQPAFILCRPSSEIDALKAVADITPAKTSDANPFAGKLEVLVDPRLNEMNSWFLVADPARLECLQYALLAGNEAPHLDTRVGFDVDGMEFKVRHDFGAGWLDHRGWVRIDY